MGSGPGKGTLLPQKSPLDMDEMGQRCLLSHPISLKIMRNVVTRSRSREVGTSAPNLHFSTHRAWGQQSPQDRSIYHKEQQQNYLFASTDIRNKIRPVIFITGFILFNTVWESYQLHLWKCDAINQGVIQK